MVNLPGDEIVRVRELLTSQRLEGVLGEDCSCAALLGLVAFRLIVFSFPVSSIQMKKKSKKIEIAIK